MNKELIDWSAATREDSGYESLGVKESLTFGRVAMLRIPIPQEVGAVRWCLVVRPIGLRIKKADKVALARKCFEIRYGENVPEVSDEALLDHVGWRISTSDNAKISRFPSPMESHKMLRDEVSYVFDRSSGAVPAELAAVV